VTVHKNTLPEKSKKKSLPSKTKLLFHKGYVSNKLKAALIF